MTFNNWKMIGKNQIPMGHKSLGLKFLEELNGMKDNSTDNNCVINFIIKELSNARDFKKYTIQRLRQEFNNIGCHTQKITSDEIIRWVQRYHPKTISVFCIDPIFQVYDKYVCSHHEVTLTFLNNNGHCYPVTLCQLCTLRNQKLRHSSTQSVAK